MGASASWAQTYTQPSGKRALSQTAFTMSGENPKRHCFHNFVKIRTTFKFTIYIYIYIYFFVCLIFVILRLLVFYYYYSDVLFRMPVFWFIILVTNFIIVCVCLDLLTLFDDLLNNLIYIYICNVSFCKKYFVVKLFFIYILQMWFLNITTHFIYNWICDG